MVTGDLAILRSKRKISDVLFYSRLVHWFGILWVVFFYCMRLLPIKFPFRMCTTANVVHFAFGLGCGCLLLYFAKVSRRGYAVLGVAFAQFSWTIGQLFWFSTVSLTDRTLPYPSIAEFGFIGTYFFLMGAISILAKDESEEAMKIGLRSFWPFTILLIPFILALKNKGLLLVNISNFLLTMAIAFTLWKVRSLFFKRKYTHFLLGVLTLCFADLTFVIGVVYFPGVCTFAIDAFYPLAHSLMAYGLVRGGIEVG